MNRLQSIPYSEVLQILGQHSLVLLLWTFVFFLLGLMGSIIVLRWLHKSAWLKREGYWKYVAMLHYLIFPLVILGVFVFSGAMLGGSWVVQQEVHRARTMLEDETREVFVRRFTEVTDTTFLKQGLLDTLTIQVLRNKMGIRPGSGIDKGTRYVIYRTRQVLLLVLTSEASGNVGVKKRHLNRLLKAYEAEDPEGVHAALMDIVEHLFNKPIKGYVWGTVLMAFFIAGLVLLLPAIEIIYHGRKYKAAQRAAQKPMTKTTP